MWNCRGVWMIAQNILGNICLTGEELQARDIKQMVVKPKNKWQKLKRYLGFIVFRKKRQKILLFGK